MGCSFSSIYTIYFVGKIKSKKNLNFTLKIYFPCISKPAILKILLIFHNLFTGTSAPPKKKQKVSDFTPLTDPNVTMAYIIKVSDVTK